MDHSPLTAAEATTVPTIAAPVPQLAETQRLLAAVETELGGKVLLYFTGSDSRIHSEDVKYFFAPLEKIGRQKKLFLIVISKGGNGESAWRIASLVRDFCDELTVIIPEVAASAATMLALSADEIIMTPLAYITAVDTSIYHPLNPRDVEDHPIAVELDEVQRALKALFKNHRASDNQVEAFKTLFSYIHPVAFGAIARSTNLSEMLCGAMMDLRRKPILAKEKSAIIKKLNEQYPSHSYPIPRQQARALGLPVRDSAPILDKLLAQLLYRYVEIDRPNKVFTTETSFYVKSIPTSIEAVSMRMSMHHHLEKRLDTILKDWITVQDEFLWNQSLL